MKSNTEGIVTHLAELIELRQRIREVPIFSTPQRRSLLVGLHHSRLRGRGVDFDQVRVYQPGDDVRHIDWRVTARTREPHTKLFHEERERPIYLLIEQSQRLFFGTQLQFKSVLVAHAAALIGWAALQHNDRIGGLVFGDDRYQEVRPRRSQHSLLQLLERLASTNQQLHHAPSPTHDSKLENLGMALRRAREVLRPGSLVVILCDERALTEAVEQQLGLLGRHIDLLLLPVSDPLDHTLPAAGQLNFTEQAQYLNLNTYDRALRQGYRQLAQQRQQRWERIARRLGSPLLPLSTQYEATEQLHHQLISHPGVHL